jgi:hypothetical protein
MKLGKSFLFMFWLGVILMIVLANSANAQDLWQFYRINAQYRGTVKKSFENIGCSLAWFKDIAPGQSQIIAHVCVENPEKRKEIFAFRTNLVVGHASDGLQLQREIYADFEGVQGQRCLEVKQLVCLWDFVRRKAQNPETINGLLNVAGRPLSLKSKKLRGRYEITCVAADRSRFSGKFFIVCGPQGVNAIDKFRFRSGRVSVSMVQDSAEAVSRDFRFRQPFSRLVFDNR